MKGKPVSERRRVTLLIESSNAYGRGLLRGIHQWTQEHEPWSLRFLERGRGEGVPPWLETSSTDGIIARVEDLRMAESLQSLRVPVVDVSAALESPVFPRILTDSPAAVRLAGEHFLDAGLRQLAFCGDDRFAWSRKREAAFAEWAAGNASWEGSFRTKARKPERVHRDLVSWLRGLSQPVGVLACYDIRGQEVLEACRAAGLRVPEDVAVMGIHNDQLLCELCDPPLSSIQPNARLAGFRAAAQLHVLMEGGQSVEEEVLIAPVGVATRQSTDLVAIEDKAIATAVRFIRDHACEGITVQDVLHEVPMARTRLEAQFRHYLGRTPREEIERVRIDRVKSLLSQTTSAIAGIAEKTGFEHPEYLAVAFKRVTGQTPRAYRNAH